MTGDCWNTRPFSLWRIGEFTVRALIGYVWALAVILCGLYLVPPVSPDAVMWAIAASYGAVLYGIEKAMP